MPYRNVTLPGVGKVRLERSSRARHIRLTVRPFEGARVAVPEGVSYAAAEAAALEKADWIRKHLDRTAVLEARAEALVRDNPLPRAAARAMIVGRVDELARRHGFSYQRVFVRRQRTRWGSCSHRNNISLNLQLARLPARLMDYAILHELVHTRIRNHGKAFWREMTRLMPDAVDLDRELDRYGGLLV